MNRLFADTSYWIALLNRKDAYYKKAKRVQGSDNVAGAAIYTTEEVLVELLAFFSAGPFDLRERAVRFVDLIMANSKITVEHQTHSSFREGLRSIERGLTRPTAWLIACRWRL